MEPQTPITLLIPNLENLGQEITVEENGVAQTFRCFQIGEKTFEWVMVDKKD